jgi:uncharacterized RDD family membrane protein YckC
VPARHPRAAAAAAGRRGLRHTPLVTFSTPVAMRRPLAGWWTRGGALAIDLLIMVAIEFVLLLIVWTVGGSHQLTLSHAETLLFEVGLPVGILYAPLLLARRGEHNGQTVGKQAMGIRVIRDNGTALTFPTALVREALGRQLLSILTYGIYAPIDYLWALRDPRTQALHDKIGRTLVVSDSGSAPVRDPAAAPGAVSVRDPGAPSSPQPVRGDWLPPVAPSPKDGG